MQPRVAVLNHLHAARRHHTVLRDLAGRHATSHAESTGRLRNPPAKEASSLQSATSGATITPSCPPLHVRLVAKNPLDPPRSRHDLQCVRADVPVRVDLFNITSSLIMLRVSHGSDALHFALRFGEERAHGAVLPASHYSPHQTDAPTAVRQIVRVIRPTNAHSRSHPRSAARFTKVQAV